MRVIFAFGVAMVGMVFGGLARAEQPATTALQPAQPASGASLQFYIKVRNQDLAEYCKAAHLGVPRCEPGKMYQANDACPPPYKVAAISCGLSDLGAEPRLVVSGTNPDQVTGACIWSFAKYPAEKAPLATTTLLCIK